MKHKFNEAPLRAFCPEMFIVFPGIIHYIISWIPAHITPGSKKTVTSITATFCSEDCQATLLVWNQIQPYIVLLQACTVGTKRPLVSAAEPGCLAF